MFNKSTNTKSSNEANPIAIVAPVLLAMIINFPIVTYITDLHTKKECHCIYNWKLNYLTYYLLFWYASSSLQVILGFLMPNTLTRFTISFLYYPSVVVSAVSYTLFIMSLWAYVEHLKNHNCVCSDIKKNKYVMTYSWFLFLVYVISVSYIGVNISSIGKH